MIAGRYTLEREIGRGGMGAVWLGRDEVLGRQVALKRIGLLPGAESTDLARAEREARLTARLNHPNVVAVFNVVEDTDSDGRWLVMEYVEGTTLAKLVKEEGRLSPDDAAPLMQQVADALVAAHAAGIVHRDVKPSNILVDRNRRAKLADFGIARITTDPALTQTGLVTGSPAYLAPEVAAGQRGDESADVWSLGATLFHVLSGQPPYDIADHVLGGLYRIVHEEPPRLAEAGWMTPLLESTMVRDPAQRWTMTEVRDFLASRGSSGGGTVPAADGAAGAAAAAGAGAGPSNGDDASSGSASPPTTPVTIAPPVPGSASAADGSGRSRRGVVLALVGLAAALGLGLLLWVVLPDDPATEPAAQSPSASPTEAPTSQENSPTEPPSPTASAQESQPSESGMASFIQEYVAAVSTDPDTAWLMLTPKFQRESGGLDTYREFWSGVGDPEVLEINANPETMVVSYRVRFENFGTGERPTVLDLVYQDGEYLIDGESTEGFVPAE